jgi:hypothetical protein
LKCFKKFVCCVLEVTSNIIFSLRNPEKQQERRMFGGLYEDLPPPTSGNSQVGTTKEEGKNDVKKATVISGKSLGTKLNGKRV